MIAAIDPGLSGAIAFIDENGAHVEDMPVVNGEVSESELANLLANKEIRHVFIERVAARPGQGVVSMFKFGMAYGVIRGVVATLGLRFTLITPNQWKKYFNLDSDKEKSRQRAIQLFPGLANDLKRKKDSGRAEALLLAEYGRRELSNGKE